MSVQSSIVLEVGTEDLSLWTAASTDWTQMKTGNFQFQAGIRKKQTNQKNLKHKVRQPNCEETK